MSARTAFHFSDLEGKTLLVTGTTSGIGKALLPGLLDQGLNLVLVGICLQTMEGIRAGLGVDESRMKLFECDLAQPEAVERLAQRLTAELPALDGILHNAAIDKRHEFEDKNPAIWSQIFQVNLHAAVTLTQHLLPLLRQSMQGRILFTGSIMAPMGGSYLSAYNASKGALVALTHSLAHELKHTGITVNCLMPGAILVEKENPTPQSNQRLIDWQSVGRRLLPADMLGPICLLLSVAGGGISGQLLTIDGGMIHPLADPEGQRRRLAHDRAEEN